MKILIVEDRPSVVQLYSSLIPNRIKGAEILHATTLAQAAGLFGKNSKEIEAVVMDGCLEGNGTTLDTLELTKLIRESGFKGPMIANSSDWNNRQLLKAGCDHETIGKGDVPDFLKALLLGPV